MIRDRDFDDDLNKKDEVEDDDLQFYHVKVRKSWFRGKDIFTERLNHYERLLLNTKQTQLRLNAGNMIYVMLQRLEVGVEWDKQAALIYSYRDLVYKLSYTNVNWFRSEMNYLHFEGRKIDVMWSLAFITQVFPDEVLDCVTVPTAMDRMNGEKPIQYSIQNGSYVGENSGRVQAINRAMPDIWVVQPRNLGEENMSDTEIQRYDATVQPVTGDVFVLPDGRTAEYIRMDERYVIAERQGQNVDSMTRHFISASLIKDFQDIVWLQTRMDYDVYRMRYIAFMSKVHELEYMLGGLEISCYDILPIGERGLPYAKSSTIRRTNEMDCGSIQYIIDKLERNRSQLHDQELKDTMQDAAKTVVNRIKGYDVEYRTYPLGGSPQQLSLNIRATYCANLYNDFAILDAYGILKFPRKVYQVLCNDPAGTIQQMTQFEREKLRTFGRGYLDFLNYQLETIKDKRHRVVYEKALSILQQRYLNRK